jgi:hypothetical protein
MKRMGRLLERGNWQPSTGGRDGFTGAPIIVIAIRGGGGQKIFVLEQTAPSRSPPATVIRANGKNDVGQAFEPDVRLENLTYKSVRLESLTYIILSNCS